MTLESTKKQPGVTNFLAIGHRLHVSACAEQSIEPQSGPRVSLLTLSGDATFALLYEENFDRIYRLIGRYGIPSADIEDVTQQVFGVALARRDELAQLENPRAWLCAVAARVVREHYRWRKVRRLRAWLVEHSWAGRAIHEGTPEASALSSEASERVHRVLEAMSTKLRDALVLTDLAELGTREAAEILAIPHNTLRSRHRLAREQFLRLWQANEAQAPRAP